MIATGIFLFLLGTKLGRASSTQYSVYQPSEMAVREQIEQSPVLIPDLRPAPYLANVPKPGSHYFPGIPYPPDIVPVLDPERTVTKIIKEEFKNVTMVSKSDITDILIKERGPVYENVVIDENPSKGFQSARLSLPIPNIALNVQPIPYLPPISIPIVNSQLVNQLPLPLQSLNVLGLPFLKSSKISRAPMIIEEPIRTSSDLIVSELDVLMKKIPPPPELPPLELKDILKPIIVEEKKVILIPYLPEVKTALPPSVVIPGRPCHLTKCARNVVFERILPNIICENSKKVELISIPATKMVPVVTSPLFPLLKK